MLLSLPEHLVVRKLPEIFGEEVAVLAFKELRHEPLVEELRMHIGDILYRADSCTGTFLVRPIMGNH